MTKTDVLIAGGGAAGYFTAIQLAMLRPGLRILILEKGKEVLTKVRVSGGGRCNVTHAAFDPRELSKFYPRGEKELLGPFHQYATGDTMEFFESHGVPLKIEEDGRIFPVSDSSESIIECFTSLAAKYRIQVRTRELIKQIGRQDSEWEVETTAGIYRAPFLVMATGSNTGIWKLLSGLGHRIVEPVPSLFTFTIPRKSLTTLSGLSREVSLNIPALGLSAQGPMLITHWGLSGPAVLRLSAWGARKLHEVDYKFSLLVNWVPEYDNEGLSAFLREQKHGQSKKQLGNTPLLELPKRLWQYLLGEAGIDPACRWADLQASQLKNLQEVLQRSEYQVEGKSTFKEEFVTAGGVELTEVNFRTFESRLLPGLYFAGEVLNIDAITGGFNFQNAWTGAVLVARALSEQLASRA